MAILLYNLLMTIVDGLVLWTTANAEAKRQLRTARLALLQAALVSLFLAATLASGFGKVRLVAYGVFVHGFLQLLGLGILWVRSRRWAGLACLGLAGLLLAVAFDAFLVEPHRLEISTYEVVSRKLTKPLRIAVLADFQTDVIGEYERRVVEEVLAGRPDLILMPGDYIQESDLARRQKLLGQLNALLKEVGFAAPLGMIAVTGNTDWPDWPSIFEGLPVTLVHQSRTLEIRGLRVTALSLRDSFDPSLSLPAADAFHIVFGHGPDFALGEIGADLLIAGHTHGGQVRLPWIGPLVTFSRIPRRWAAGMTELSGDRHLVVSRGIGLERDGAPPLRFLCRPQLVFIDLKPAEE